MTPPRSCLSTLRSLRHGLTIREDGRRRHRATHVRRGNTFIALRQWKHLDGSRTPNHIDSLRHSGLPITAKEAVTPMAATNNRNSETFSVQGRVFDATTKAGIGGLLVTVYGINKDFGRARDGQLGAMLKDAIRGGTALSDENGGFALSYERGDVTATRGEKRRPNLLVVVSAPDDEN